MQIRPSDFDLQNDPVMIMEREIIRLESACRSIFAQSQDFDDLTHARTRLSDFKKALTKTSERFCVS